MKIGDWVKLKRLEDAPHMVIVEGPNATNANGFKIESVLVFWLDANDCAQIAELPTSTLDITPE
jgi:hypothetical protein